MQYYKGIDTDEYVVIPNHMHGTIIIDHNDVGAPPCGRPLIGANQNEEPRAGTGACPYG
ncbi:MAG: hypothetical protein R6V04_02110 [bacterium]